MATTVTLTLWEVTSPAGVALMRPAPPPPLFRISDAGGALYLVRDDRATAYWVDLETNTAAARRLRYWRVPDGTEEFQRVCVHNAPGF